MKKSTLLLVFLLSLFLVNCEKVDPKMEILTDPDTEINSSQLKSAQVNSCGEMIYLNSLIEDIESMVGVGSLNKGNGNALIVKIKNAMKSVEKCNTTAASNQLSALINQLEAFVKNGILEPVPGALLITRAENGIDMLKLINTTWDFLVIFEDNSSWHADVTFYPDGTTRYDEPADPGTYLSFGTWSIEGNILYYIMDSSDPVGTAYHFTGTLSCNTMNGTYTFPGWIGPFTWTATLK